MNLMGPRNEMNSPLLERTRARRFKPGLPIRILLVLLVLVALAALLLFLTRPRLPYRLGDYERAVKAGDDEKVFEIYNALREKRAVLSDARQTDRVESLLAEADRLIEGMEADAGRRGEALIRSLLAGAVLTEDEVNWLDRYAGLAGQGVLGALAEATGQFLNQAVEEEAFLHLLREITRVPQLARDYKALLDRQETLLALKEGLEKVNDTAAKGGLYQEALAIQKLVAGTDLTGLDPVRDYLEDRLERVWQAYYQEEIPLIRQEMDRDRTYDASIRIKRLIGRFEGDEELLAFQAICEKRNPEAMTTWWDPVEHIGVKPLIADPARAFDGDRFQEAADRDLLLTGEFERLLRELYERDYVLVDSRSFADEEGRLRGIPCPVGKKPLVLVLEDFYSSLPRAESGLAWRLDVNDQGQVEGVLLDEDGQERSDRAFTAIGILEAFLEEHPSFSFNGATGTIALVGQYGLFGYPVADIQDLALRRNAEESELALPGPPISDFSHNRQKLAAVVEALEARNWKLSSGTYERLSLPFTPASVIRQDLILMERWVEPYTGKLTSLYCPFGDHVEFDQAKLALFAEAGYTLQSGYGTWAYWDNPQGHVYVTRTYLSGAGLRRPGASNLNRFFDASKVYDAVTRP